MGFWLLVESGYNKLFYIPHWLKLESGEILQHNCSRNLAI